MNRSATRLSTAGRAGAIVIFAAGCIVTFGAKSSFAQDAPAPARYTIAGAATLPLDAQIQSAGRLQLKATLQPVGAGSSGPMLLSGGRFAVSATLAASSLVCYADTIYRDDFDGDGF